MKDIKTEKGKKINKKSLIVALDVAQEKHVVYMRSSDEMEEKMKEYLAKTHNK
ncbi:MAG: hypothetical protein HUU08_02960 [Candidatus Brocadia sp.]|nr:hypothetical protein [Candidatus Brocadia sp.]